MANKTTKQRVKNRTNGRLIFVRAGMRLLSAIAPPLADRLAVDLFYRPRGGAAAAAPVLRAPAAPAATRGGGPAPSSLAGAYPRRLADRLGLRRRAHGAAGS